MGIKLSTLHSVSSKLVEEAKIRDYLHSHSTIKCQICPAIYPKDYEQCPRCELEKSFEDFEKIK